MKKLFSFSLPVSDAAGIEIQTHLYELETEKGGKGWINPKQEEKNERTTSLLSECY